MSKHPATRKNLWISHRLLRDTAPPVSSRYRSRHMISKKNVAMTRNVLQPFNQLDPYCDRQSFSVPSAGFPQRLNLFTPGGSPGFFTPYVRWTIIIPRLAYGFSTKHGLASTLWSGRRADARDVMDVAAIWCLPQTSCPRLSLMGTGTPSGNLLETFWCTGYLVPDLSIFLHLVAQP